MTQLTLIHGFTQDSRVWEETVALLPSDWEISTIDLPGHGRKADQRPSDPTQFLTQVQESVPPGSTADRRILCGYSMGGRVALNLAADSPGRWTDLVIVSSGAGISNTEDRFNRQQADESLATRLLDEGWMQEFAAHWDSLPIWTGDPQQVRQARIEMLLDQAADGLAAALRSFGQGIAPVFMGFGPGEIPTLTVLRGERDTAYIDPSEHLAMLAGTAPTVVTGGHSLPLENPAALAEALVDL